MPDQPVFDAAALRSAREAAGLTQHQLARLIDVAGGERVSRWELGLSVPRPLMVKRLAQALEVDPERLAPAALEALTLRALRVRAGLGAREVAAAAHVSEATYRRWEAGTVASNLPVDALAVVLGVPADAVVRASGAARDGPGRAAQPDLETVPRPLPPPPPHTPGPDR